MFLSNLLEARTTATNPDWWREMFYPQRKSAAGVDVTPVTAMGLPAYFACVRVIGETIGGLPFMLYRSMSPRGKERVRDHPVYRAIHVQPNPETTPIKFWDTIATQIATFGNAYAEIVRFKRTGEIQLWLLPADSMEVKRDKDGVLVYTFTKPDGTRVHLRKEKVLHIPGFGGDAIVGLSPTAAQRDTIGLGLAALEHSGAFYARGAKPAGVLEAPPEAKMDEVKSKAVRENFDRIYGGSDNDFRTVVLTGGMVYKPVTIPAKDAKTIEMFQLNGTQVCGIFRVPPHKIGILDRATYSNIEEQGLDFLQTIDPYTKRIAQEVGRKLLADEPDLFTEHVLEGLLRGDIETRYKAHAIARQWGWESPNDVLEIENKNPIADDDGGNSYMVPMNMQSLERLDEPPEPAPAPVLPEDPDDDGEDDNDDERSMGRLAEAHRGLFEDAYNRILRVELDKLKRAARRADFATWLDGFYAEHARVVRGVMGAPIDALGGVAYSQRTGRAVDDVARKRLMGYTADWADRHVELSRAAVTQAVAQASSPTVGLATLAERWADRPAQMAEQEVRQLLQAVQSWELN